ncbi:DegT/DnrJ/EryC1/StrS family aminotransferase [Candidatus Woesearchaeota archaeon]|nr:DegT/DnrJ/EryC1/StrS family aminotransferase [Candidatus Woesearchaeota archaeon]
MKEKVYRLLKEYTKHDYIELTSRGNTAIFAALHCARKLSSDKKAVLVPDQGGWFTYLKYPKMLEMEAVEIKTDYGVIEIEDLRNKIKCQKSSKKISENAKKPSGFFTGANCLIYANPAGYFAEQPMKEIYEICKKNNCMVIMDATGSIGSDLCEGDYADIIVGSFGKWKPVNAGYGGFLSAKEKDYFNKSKEIFNTEGFEEKYLPLLYEKLKNTGKRYRLFEKINKKIKKDLKGYKILHESKKGINVIVKFADEKEKNKIIDYCVKNKHQYTICPRYIRVNEKAVSIEIKREE